MLLTLMNSKKGKARRAITARLAHQPRLRDASSVRLSFNIPVTFSFVASSTAQGAPLSFTGSVPFPSTSRLAKIAPNFSYFKFVSLTIRVEPFSDTTTSDQSLAVGYVPYDGPVMLPPYNSLLQFEEVRLMSSKRTTGTLFHCPWKLLNKYPEKLFDVVNGTSVNSHVQGTVVVAPRSNMTSTLTILLSGVVEFSQWNL